MIACGDPEINGCGQLAFPVTMMMMMKQPAAANLVFLFEFLCGSKVQQTHVDQLLEVLVKSKDVLPEVKNRKAAGESLQQRKLSQVEGKRVTFCKAAAFSSGQAATGPGSAVSQGH